MERRHNVKLARRAAELTERYLDEPYCPGDGSQSKAEDDYDETVERAGCGQLWHDKYDNVIYRDTNIELSHTILYDYGEDLYAAVITAEGGNYDKAYLHPVFFVSVRSAGEFATHRHRSGVKPDLKMAFAVWARRAILGEEEDE